eukprot:GHRQ01026324.1.p2 GENE.GHRQ01026324.1~~GHRQ01026324.1.p2  ORF type:complete len:229 (+),score=87.02 GHRQ01026324.1:86-688(+)
MDPLLRLMSSVYLPQVSNSSSWGPDAVRREFLAYTHRFMASLTEAVNEAKGQTVLYMPAGELGDRTPAEAARGKHLTQRLETTLMYWTRQVTNVLNKQDCGDGGQQAGPLLEIEFWRSRSLDLSSIRAQLEDKQVSMCGCQRRACDIACNSCNQCAAVAGTAASTRVACTWHFHNSGVFIRFLTLVKRNCSCLACRCLTW